MKLKVGMKVRFTGKYDTFDMICCLREKNKVRLIDVNSGHHWGSEGYKTLEELNTSLGVFTLIEQEGKMQTPPVMRPTTNRRRRKRCENHYYKL